MSLMARSVMKGISFENHVSINSIVKTNQRWQTGQG